MINKQLLINLCDYQPGHLGYTKITKNEKRLEILDMKEFSDCIRFLTRIYLLKLCPLSIVTSRKMRKEVWKQHLGKCRVVYNSLFKGEQSENDEEKEEYHENDSL